MADNKKVQVGGPAGKKSKDKPKQQQQQVQQASGAAGPSEKGAVRPKVAICTKDVTDTINKMRIEPESSGSQRSGSKKSSKKSASSKTVPIRFVPRPERHAEQAPGQVVRLITNLIRILVSQGKDLYQSGVNVELVKDCSVKDGEAPVIKKLGNETRREALSKVMEHYLKENRPDFLHRPYRYLSDYNASTLLTLFDVSGGDASKVPYESIVSLNKNYGEGVETQSEYKVTIYKSERISLDNRSTAAEHMRALNMILTYKYWSIDRFFLSRAPTGQTSIFSYEQERQFDIGGGIFCNKGYRVSARAAECGIVLNVANTSALFYEDCHLLEFINKRYGVKIGQKLSRGVVEELTKEIKSKQVEAMHLNYGTKQNPRYRKFRVDDIGGSAHDKFTFVDSVTKTCREITIRAYYELTYNITLRFPDLPCIIDNGRKIPLELCKLVERQRVHRRLTRDECSTVVKKSSVPALKNLNEAAKNVQEMYQSSNDLVKEYGIELNPKPIEIEGRELPQISIKAGGEKTVFTSEGQYNVHRMAFYKPATQIKSWAMAFLKDRSIDKLRHLNLDRKTREIFSKEYCQAARSRGIVIGSVAAVHFIPDGSGSIESMAEMVLRNTLDRYYAYCNIIKYDHVIFVLPAKCPDWVYGYLQYLEASVRRPSATEWWTRASCMKLANFESKVLGDQRRSSMFISNLWLKYNTKMGGTNFVLNIKPTDTAARHFRPGYLYVAVDVCHPAPGDKLIQSVAAVVGMWHLTGPSGISYCTRIRVQKKEKEKSTIEHVIEIDKMFEDILDSYWQSKKSMPTHVVVLRDGVSEGQFEIVLTEELIRLQQVSFNKAKKALPMSCFVVQKRHKVRFRRKEPVKNKHGDDDYNIRPGTVVDREVTHPTDHSFYIAPHKAIQGTTRAAYVYMILDEIGFSQDEAQAMIFSLSYLSPRCTKATSIPTPVNLADRAAERGKNLVIAWNSINSTRMSDEDRISELNKFLADIGDENYRHTLYYI